MEALSIIYDVVRDGGPIAVSSIFVAAWWLERKERQASKKREEALVDKIFELSSAQVATSSKLEPAISNLKDLLIDLKELLLFFGKKS